MSLINKNNINHNSQQDCEQIKPQSPIVRHSLWIGFTLLVFAVLVKLSLWQHSRGIEKEQRLTRMTELNQQSPLTLDAIVLLSSDINVDNNTTGPQEVNINDYPVTIVGNFDSEKVFLLDNQVEKNSLGYRVFQIVTTEQYSVLANLGWVQGSIDRQALPEFTPVVGTHQFTGHVRLIESGIMLMEQNLKDVSWPLRVQQIEIEKFAKLLNKPLLPFAIYLDKNEKVGYKKNWHPIVMPPEKHQAYAVQWAGLALAWLALMIWFNLFERSIKQHKDNPKHKKNNRREETSHE